MEEVLEFLKNCKAFFVATLEEGTQQGQGNGHGFVLAAFRGL